MVDYCSVVATGTAEDTFRRRLSTPRKRGVEGENGYRGPHLFHIHERRLKGQMTHILHHKPRPPSTRCSCDLPRTAATYSGRYNIMKKINRGSHKNVFITRNHTLILLLSAGEHLPRHHELPTQPSRKKDQESDLFLSKTNVTQLNSPTWPTLTFSIRRARSVSNHQQHPPAAGFAFGAAGPHAAAPAPASLALAKGIGLPQSG